MSSFSRSRSGPFEKVNLESFYIIFILYKPFTIVLKPFMIVLKPFIVVIKPFTIILPRIWH